jgi:hypothetical protein
MNMEYNTGRGLLMMREYGRHVHKMVYYLMSLEDKAERSKNAHAIIELMGFLNPQLKTMEDYRHKLWDHLFVISDFKLDVDCPYPIPDRATYKAKPDPLPYPKRYPKYAHLGKNLQSVIEKALAEPAPEKRNGFINVIAHYMKLSYSNWHKELVHDDSIRQELSTITKGELEMVDQTPFVKHFRTVERDDYGRGSKPQNRRFSRPNNNDRRDKRGGGMDNRGGGMDNRGGGGGQFRGNDNRDNRGGGGRPDNNRNKNFKKRY